MPARSVRSPPRSVRRSLDESGASMYSRIDLNRRPLGVLQRMAMECGVDGRSVCAAIDSSSPKDTLIGLILSAEDPTSVESRDQEAKLRGMREAEHELEEIKRDELARRLQQAKAFAGALRRGQCVYYFDLLASTWLPAVVDLVHKDSYHVDLRSKDWCARRVDAQRIRKPTALEEEERREQHTRLRIGERVQYFNQPSADWIEAVITDVAQNAAGRVNGVELSVLYSKHWPIEDVVVPRVPLKQIRALTEHRAEDERQRQEVRWSAALRSAPADGAGGSTDLREEVTGESTTYWGDLPGVRRSESPSPIAMPSESGSDETDFEGETDGPTRVPVTMVEQPLPPGWESALSRSTGEVYYINTHTQESSYDVPTGPAPVGGTIRSYQEPEPDHR